jgi:hypothetical protein
VDFFSSLAAIASSFMGVNPARTTTTTERALQLQKSVARSPVTLGLYVLLAAQTIGDSTVRSSLLEFAWVD